MYIYIIKNRIAFYDNPDDYGAEKLHKRLIEKYGCEPVIIGLDADADCEFEVSGKITPEQLLHLMTQTIYGQQDCPATYELTADGYDACRFGRKGDEAAPYVFADNDTDIDILPASSAENPTAQLSIATSAVKPLPLGMGI